LSALKRTARLFPRAVRRDDAHGPHRGERTGAPAGERVLLFEVGGQPCAISAAFLLEVALLEGSLVVTGSAGGESGVFSHRGFSIPGVDLRALFGYPGGSPREATRVLVGEVAGQRFGLVVDSVGDVVEVATGAILPLPEKASRLPSECFRGIVCRGDQVVLVLEAAGLAALECVERFGEVVAFPRAEAGRGTG
jgi:purine-binding chemotaxis protein CheW